MSAPAVSPAPRRVRAVQEIAEEAARVSSSIAAGNVARAMAALETLREPDPEIFEALEQGTPEWLAVRAGIATASEFSCLLVDGKGRPDGLAAGALTYARYKAWERITGRTAAVFSTAATERGHAVEPLVRAEYEFVHGVSVRQVGFVRRFGAGYSPDGLVGLDGLVEIKTHNAERGLPMVLSPECPKDHSAQIYGGLWITGRAWCDLLISVEGIETHCRRVDRDEAVIAKLAERVEAFGEEVERQIEAIEAAYGRSRDELRAAGGLW